MQSQGHSRQRCRVSTTDPIDSAPIREHNGGTRAGELGIHGCRLPVLEEDEGRHSGDAIAARDVVHVVDVDLGEGEVTRDGVLVRQLGEDRRYGPAGRAPVGIEVDDDVGGGLEQGVELSGLGGLVHVAGRLRDGGAILEEGLRKGSVGFGGSIGGNYR